MIHRVSSYGVTVLLSILWLSGCARKDEARRTIPGSVQGQPAPTSPAPSKSAQPTLEDLNSAQRAVRAAPRDGRARFDLGLIQVALGQVPEGVESLRKAARLSPHSLAPDAYLEHIYQQAGYLDWEVEALRHLAALHSPDPNVYLRLAQIYGQLQWLEPAGPVLKQALKLSPEAPDIQREMAHFEFEGGKTQEAIARLQALHRRDVHDPFAASLLTQYLVTVNRVAEAEAVVRETLRLNPDNVKLKLLLAHTLEIGNRPDVLPEAVSLAQDVLRTSPDNVEAYVWLARADERLQQHDEAQRAYEAVVRLDPTFENVALKLGQIYLHAGKTSEGERLVHLYQKLNINSIAYGVAIDHVRHHYTDPAGHTVMADWYTRTKEYGKAITEYKQALQLRPMDGSTRAKLLATLVAGGRTREANRMRTTPDNR